MVCDSATGYAFNILTYFGNDTSYNSDTYGMGQSEKIFEFLLKPLGKGHHIFADRYYTTHSLISYLTSKSFHYTGTLQTNRKNFPDNIKFQKGCRMKHLQTNYYRSESGILLVQWQDKKAKKPVVAVSTKFAKNVVAVSSHRKGVREIPEIIHRYNLSMNGCDRLDQSVSERQLSGGKEFLIG